LLHSFLFILRRPPTSTPFPYTTLFRSESIYQQFYDEPRFRPSPITAVRLQGNVLGRKTGEGFYAYVDGQKHVALEPAAPSLPQNLTVWVAPWHAVGHKRVAALLKGLGVAISTAPMPPDDALVLVTP